MCIDDLSKFIKYLYTCRRDGQSCMFNDDGPTGYESYCKQKYIYKKLLALDPEGKAITDTFRLPSCCVCFLRSAFVSDRINTGKPNFPNPKVSLKKATTVTPQIHSSANSTSSTVRVNASIINDDIGSFEAVSDELIITRNESDLKILSPNETDVQTTTHSIVFE